WTQFDAINGVFNPYDPVLGFAANLGYRAIIVFGIPVVFIVLAAIVNSVRGNGIGISWFPLVLMLFAIEYFVYDDQFTLIALIVVPIILAGAYRLLFRDRLSIRATENGDGSEREDFLITYIKFSLMSLAIAEVLSTALTVGGIAIIRLTAPPPFGGNIVLYLASLLPHAIIEIPVFLVAAAAAIRIAKDLWPTVEAEDWASIPSKTKSLLSDGRTWRTFALIVFLLVIAALVEAYVTHHIMGMV
ncbi:MAG: stage II sporulation protein M, partial [Candidatus Thorarchaeota archaeon]|nr:stage II sporulation protein M [Candidatus Thorarchaeota archaeon]